MEKDTVVLAYSGGLDTSCILVWLIQQGYRVIPCMVNVGQLEDFEVAKEKALKLGAERIYVEDVRKEFVEEFVWPAVRAGVTYEGRYLLGTALARPCIARCLIKVAELESAKYISHGATGKGNDQVRFELSCYALSDRVRFIAPWRQREFVTRFAGRKDLLDFATSNHIPVKHTKDKNYSEDDNLMHISYEAGILEDPEQPAPAGMWRMTRDPEDAPDEPEFLQIDFVEGVPVKVVAGEESVTSSVDIMDYLNKKAGRHGIGRIDIVENRFIGMKSRGCYETPAGTVIWAAHQDLEIITLDKEVLALKRDLAEKLGKLIYNGMWFSPECEYLQTCIELTQSKVEGSVHLKLYKGCVSIMSRNSRNSLYNQELVSMDVAGDYEPADVSGFIRINALRLREHLRAHKIKS